MKNLPGGSAKVYADLSRLIFKSTGCDMYRFSGHIFIEWNQSSINRFVLERMTAPYMESCKKNKFMSGLVQQENILAVSGSFCQMRKMVLPLIWIFVALNFGITPEPLTILPGWRLFLPDSPVKSSQRSARASAAICSSTLTISGLTHERRIVRPDHCAIFPLL